MKKWIVGVCLLLLLAIISIYFLIPSNIVLTKSIIAKANPAGAYRFLNTELNWQKWWPDTSADRNQMKAFESDGYQFKKNKSLFNSFEITIEKNEGVLSSFLQLFSLSNDSTRITWSASINTGIDPFTRIQRYFKAKKIGRNLEIVLAAMAEYMSNIKNIYGLDIKEEKVQIEFMVSTKKNFSNYPTTENIYELVGQIKKHIALSRAEEEDYPMLHINTLDSVHYEVQVAIPVNKQLPDSGIFSSKRMLKGGNILMAEITGGKNTADYGMKQVDLYISDHQYNNVAIPFQSLITDRTKETDTSKWVTKIYYPIR